MSLRKLFKLRQKNFDRKFFYHPRITVIEQDKSTFNPVGNNSLLVGSIVEPPPKSYVNAAGKSLSEIFNGTS